MVFFWLMTGFKLARPTLPSLTTQKRAYERCPFLHMVLDAIDAWIESENFSATMMQCSRPQNIIPQSSTHNSKVSFSIPTHKYATSTAGDRTQKTSLTTIFLSGDAVS